MEVRCDATLYGTAAQRIKNSMCLFNNKVYHRWLLARRLFDVRDIWSLVASLLLIDYHSTWSNRLLVSLSWECPIASKMTDDWFGLLTGVLLGNTLSFDAADICARYARLLLRLAAVKRTGGNERVLYIISRNAANQNASLHSAILTALSEEPRWGVNRVWISHLLLDACLDLGADEFARALYNQLILQGGVFAVPMSTAFAVKVVDAANRWNQLGLL